MSNVQMIRKEPGLVSIPVEMAVYYENCDKVSNSTWLRCGLCGSEEIVELAPILCGDLGEGATAGASKDGDFSRGRAV
jgi:hypothetical protein